MAKQTTLYMSDGSTLEEVLVATDYSLVKNKPSNFPPTAHNHPISQVTGLQGALDGKADLPLASLRDFINGTTIYTDIDYSQTSGAPFLLKIYGNTYSRLTPTETVIQGYIYNDTIINYGGYSVGNPISGLVALNVGGKLTFWFPRQGYWEGYFAEIYDVGGAESKANMVTSIVDSTKPVGTKEVTFSNTLNTILSNDLRLTNSRPASDVHDWAKAENRPTYSASDVGALPIGGKAYDSSRLGGELAAKYILRDDLTQDYYTIQQIDATFAEKSSLDTVVNQLDSKSFKVLTTAQYNALSTKDTNTIYFIT